MRVLPCFIGNVCPGLSLFDDVVEVPVVSTTARVPPGHMFRRGHLFVDAANGYPEVLIVYVAVEVSHMLFHIGLIER